MKRKLVGLIILSFLVVLGACSVSDEEIARAILKTQEANKSLTPEIVERIVIEVIITATPDPLENQASNGSIVSTTPTSDPSDPELPKQCLEDLSNLSIYGAGYLENGDLLITLEHTLGVEEDIYILKVGNVSLECTVLDAYLDRLYCVGQKIKSGVEVEISLTPLELDCSLFKGKLFVPSEITPPDNDDGSDDNGGPPPTTYP